MLILNTKHHPLSTHSALSIACFTLSVRTCPYFPYNTSEYNFPASINNIFYIFMFLAIKNSLVVHYENLIVLGVKIRRVIMVCHNCLCMKCVWSYTQILHITYWNILNVLDISMKLLMWSIISFSQHGFSVTVPSLLNNLPNRLTWNF